MDTLIRDQSERWWLRFHKISAGDYGLHRIVRGNAGTREQAEVNLNDRDQDNNRQMAKIQTGIERRLIIREPGNSSPAVRRIAQVRGRL